MCTADGAPGGPGFDSAGFGSVAEAAVRRMRAIAKHPLLARGMAAGEISESWAREIAAWLRKLPEELREGTEGILAEAAAAGASLEDLAVITAHALAQWEAEPMSSAIDVAKSSSSYSSSSSS